MGWSPFRKTGLTYHNPARSFKGYTLIAPPGNAVYLIDMAGKVVKRWHFPGLEPQLATFSSQGTLLVSAKAVQQLELAQAARKEELLADLDLHYTRLGGGFTTLREYDFVGDLLWSSANPAMHHDYYLTADDHLLLPIWRPIPDEVARTIRGGVRKRNVNQPPMIGDDVIKIDRDGNELERHHIWQYFDPRRDPIKPLQDRLEWTHLNSIDLTPDGDLIASCRNNSRVAILDLQKQKIIWKIGDPMVSLQHHATLVVGGNIQIFDNGAQRPLSGPSSRVIEVDPKTSDIVWEYKGQPPHQFFSSYISSAQRLPTGNVLICEGASGRLFEVTRGGEIVWEWINPFVDGQPDGSVSCALYRAYRYELDHPAVARQELDPTTYAKINAAYGLT